MTKKQPILNASVEQLQVSTEFIAMCKVNGFKTLEDIVKLHAWELTRKPEFNMRILKELIMLLESYGIEDLLKD